MNTKSELVNSMNKLHRYPGTKPFSSDQKGIFFGRSEDIAGLAELINIEQLSVLYSKSGLGKSSLINAGVLPKLEKEDRLIPYSLRFGAYTANNTASPLSITTQTIGYSGETKLLDKIIPKDNSLWYHLKSDQIAKQEKRGYLLIFDQFEELFTYPEAQIAAFGKQLAELLYTTIPERFRKVVESEIWEKGNQSFCLSYILVDFSLVHTGGRRFITGYIETEEDNGVAAVNVEVEGSFNQTIVTQGDGYYQVSNFPINADIQITPYLNKDHLNGVSTFDLILISQHILGLTPLSSPYKMVAADVNNDQQVTTLDIIELRKNILGFSDDFTNNMSWRFIPGLPSDALRLR